MMKPLEQLRREINAWLADNPPNRPSALIYPTDDKARAIRLQRLLRKDGYRVELLTFDDVIGVCVLYGDE